MDKFIYGFLLGITGAILYFSHYPVVPVDTTPNWYKEKILSYIPPGREIKHITSKVNLKQKEEK